MARLQKRQKRDSTTNAIMGSRIGLQLPDHGRLLLTLHNRLGDQRLAILGGHKAVQGQGCIVIITADITPNTKTCGLGRILRLCCGKEPCAYVEQPGVSDNWPPRTEAMFDGDPHFRPSAPMYINSSLIEPLASGALRVTM